MRDPIHFVPILTTVLALVFAPIILRRYRERGGTHLLWWGLGVLLYGVGTATESAVTLFGSSPALLKTWYISGALLGGAPLAQGTVYLLLSGKVADRLAAALLSVVAVASVAVILSPVDMTVVASHRLSGAALTWSWVRLFSPFINTYAFLFLVGGAVLSAVRAHRVPGTRHRFVGNVLIAIGALLPGIGGMSSRMGHTEVLYATELVGLILIWAGYHTIVRKLWHDPVPDTQTTA